MGKHRMGGNPDIDRLFIHDGNFWLSWFGSYIFIIFSGATN
jgi:hypothetical protein